MLEGDTIKIVYKNSTKAGRDHCKNVICTRLDGTIISWLYKNKNNYYYSWEYLKEISFIPVKMILYEKIKIRKI